MDIAASGVDETPRTVSKAVEVNSTALDTGPRVSGNIVTDSRATCADTEALCQPVTHQPQPLLPQGPQGNAQDTYPDPQSILNCDPSQVQYYVEKRHHLRNEILELDTYVNKLTSSSQTCFGCSQEEPSPGTFKVCTKCKFAKYCSKACQSSHWKNGHKAICTQYGSDISRDPVASLKELRRTSIDQFQTHEEQFPVFTNWIESL